MQGVTQRKHVADGVGGRERDGSGAYDAGIEQRQREQRRRQPPGIFLQSNRGAESIGVVPEFGLALEDRGGESDHRSRAQHHERDPDPKIQALVSDEARRDPLIDDIALLEEQLPGSHRGADDGDDQQHHFAQWYARRQPRDKKVAGKLADRRVNHDDNGHQQQTCEGQKDGEALEAPKAAGADREHDDGSGNKHAPKLRQAEIAERQADADELGHDRQRIEQEQVDDAEGAPELAEALQDQPGVTDTGDGAETHDHFLVHVENRDQEHQGPQQCGAVVLAGLRISPEGARIVVTDHHDQPGAKDCDERLPTRAATDARRHVALADRSERSTDIADMGIVERCDAMPAQLCGGLIGSGHNPVLQCSDG